MAPSKVYWVPGYEQPFRSPLFQDRYPRPITPEVLRGKKYFIIGLTNLIFPEGREIKDRWNEAYLPFRDLPLRQGVEDFLRYWRKSNNARFAFFSGEYETKGIENLSKLWHLVEYVDGWAINSGGGLQPLFPNLCKFATGREASPEEVLVLLNSNYSFGETLTDSLDILLIPPWAKPFDFRALVPQEATVPTSSSFYAMSHT